MNWLRKWWGGPKPSGYFGDWESYQPPHWTAQLIRKCTRFCAKEWKWVIGAVCSGVAFIVTHL